MKNKQFLALIFSMIFCFFNNAQNTEKIKGNRSVTIQQTLINSFHTIMIDDDFEVDIIYNKEPSVEIETDENLHEFIEFQVRDSILSFHKTRRITSKKRLYIKVNYDDFLAHIETRDNGEIHALTTMELNNVNVKTTGNSRAGLTIKTDMFNFEGLDKSKVKLNLTCDSTKLIINGYSKLEALINSPILHADLYQRSNAIIEGNSDELTLIMDNNSQFNGKNFTVKTCNVLCEIASDATLEVTDTITLEASGASEIYLYNNPKIIVNKLTDTSKIQKRVK